MEKMYTKPQAVIESGSTGIRLLVAEMTADKKRNILDRSELPVSIGRDVFTQGFISRESIVSCLQIMKRFAEQLSAWGILPGETTVLGTSAVREAANRDPFVDRIKIKTGFIVRVIDGIEENRLMYIAVWDCLKEESLSVQQSDSIILEIAGGTTEMMLMEKGRMVGAHSFRLGTVIIEQQMRSMLGTLEDAERFIEEFISSTKVQLSTEMSLSKIKQFIAVGGDMKVVSLFAGKSITPFLWQIERNDFFAFVDEVLHCTIEEVVARFKMTYSDAQSFQISLLSYRQFIMLTNVQNIIVPETSLREGVLISLMAEPEAELQKEFNAQIAASATTLLKKYQGDVRHAMYVRDMSLRIYDAMQMEHGFDPKVRLLLEISAILHDIGVFIQPKDHNVHSRYIISHSEIFGLSSDDKSLVAQIALYHRGTEVPQNNPEFSMLPRESRMIILKLSAILRVADALDRGHQQKLANFTINFAKDSITFRVHGHTNLNLERLALEEKDSMFENVFGYKVVLV